MINTKSYIANAYALTYSTAQSSAHIHVLLTYPFFVVVVDLTAYSKSSPPGPDATFEMRVEMLRLSFSNPTAINLLVHLTAVSGGFGRPQCAGFLQREVDRPIARGYLHQRQSPVRKDQQPTTAASTDIVLLFDQPVDFSECSRTTAVRQVLRGD